MQMQYIISIYWTDIQTWARLTTWRDRTGHQDMPGVGSTPFCRAALRAADHVDLLV